MANEASTCSCSGGPLSTNSTERGMNDRIKRLRRQSLDTQPHIYMERAQIETEVYKKYEGTVSVPELRALVLKEFFSKKTLYLVIAEIQSLLQRRTPSEPGHASSGTDTVPSYFL